MSSRIPLEAARGEVRADPPHDAPDAQAAAKPHVCFLAPTTWPLLSGDRDIPVVGGAEVQQSMLARALARRGYRVSMVCFDYGQPDRTVVDGVTVYNMHKPDEGIPVLRFVHPRLTSLWRALTRVDADVYYQRTAAAYTGFLAAFCRRYGRRSIFAGASDVDFLPGEQDIRFARDRRIFEYGLRRVDRVIVQNPAQLASVKRNYGRDAVVVPSCYAPPAGARADRSGYVLWVATLRESKRPEILLDIARCLPQHSFVVIGGSDPDRRGTEFARRFEAAARALPNVEVRGFLPFAEADRCFDGARLVVNTSLYEGFPNTFLQAWARGIPTVGFVDTGSRRAGEPVYDIARDLPEACMRVGRLMTDDIVWREASQRAAAHFQATHSIDAVVDVYEREILAQAARR